MNWTEEQWKAWLDLPEWSHKTGYEGAKKLLDHAGIPQETLTASQIFNIQDDIAYALRRGAIRILNKINNNDGDTGEF